MWIAIIWVITVIVAFIAGLLVYRNNAKRFQDIEAQAQAKGKTISDVIKII